MDEVADIAYDKAVEVVADTVKLETHKEDIKLWSSLRHGFSP